MPRCRAFAFLTAALVVSVAFMPVSDSLAGATGPRDRFDPSPNSEPPESPTLLGTTDQPSILVVVVWIRDPGGTTNTVIFSGLSPIYETSGCVRHVYANGLRLARLYGGCSSTKEYYHYDHLGNVRVFTSSTGTRLATLAYRPFGACAYGCASEPTYGYTGEYREAPPNLVYLHSRWYDPTIGRFLSPDDHLGRLSMPQYQNR